MPSNSSLFFGAKQEIFEKARLLRQNMTPAENALWEKLKDRKLMGFKFRRQHPIAHFVADFYCPETKLVIEIDGNIHQLEEQINYDQIRTDELDQMGLNILRFDNEKVLNNCEAVVDGISKTLKETSSPSPNRLHGSV